ncbi:MAG: helix-turn-helix domain-containing protein [Lachnospiraceae bacterium]|nr:helix-turn-helix domain-containing protein [Lachnospiraceae bacterium]
MEIQIGKNIRSLRCRRLVSQEDLAQTMGVTVQAISKWETGKANPDLQLLPKLAEYFGVTIDSLFAADAADEAFYSVSAHALEQNSSWWAGISEADMTTTALPNYAFFTPTEDTLCLLGDVRGKTVLELACGGGESLVWMNRRGAKELWGLDISAAQIRRAGKLLKDNNIAANLFVSPMELNPGLPHGHFDLVYSIYGIGWAMSLENTILHIAEYLKPGGRLVFSWDNPLMQCIASKGGQHVLSRSYVKEEDIVFVNQANEPPLCLHNRKLSAYLNCLADHGFFIEQVVEESAYNENEADVFEEGKLYSAARARLVNPAFIVRARKL